MSIEQAKAQLLQTAWYMLPPEVKDHNQKMAMLESTYRKCCDIIGFDTPETTVMRRLAAQIEKELQSPTPPQLAPTLERSTQDSKP